MGPLLGPVASALLAALCAGIVLGVVRLRSLSLAWWRGRVGVGVRPRDPDGALVETRAPEDVRALRRAADATLLLAVVGGAGLAFAPMLGPSTFSLPADPSTAPGGPASGPLGAAALAPLLATALMALVFGLVAAAVTAVLERVLGMLLARLGRPGAGTAPGLPLSELWRTARAALPGREQIREPLGAGLATSVIFATSIAAWAALLAALAGHPPPATALAAGAALLALPLAYAVAADRTPNPVRARARQDTALRQLAVAPVWVVALVVLAVPTAAPLVRVLGIVLLALASGATLPGTVTGGRRLALPTRGDADAPGAAVRALTDASHYAWLSAWALGLALVVTAGHPTDANRAGTAIGLLFMFLVLRRLLTLGWPLHRAAARPERA